jgi:hypothetical protein
MPVVPYYLGRPASVWIAAMAKRGFARQPRTGTGPGLAGNPGQLASARPSAPVSSSRPDAQAAKETGDERPC